jgi:multidrug efflux pump subunit AcrA (membrane-fusion protein)
MKTIPLYLLALGLIVNADVHAADVEVQAATQATAQAAVDANRAAVAANAAARQAGEQARAAARVSVEAERHEGDATRAAERAERERERAARDQARAEAGKEREKKRLHREQFHKDEVPFALVRREDGNNYSFIRSVNSDANREIDRAKQSMKGEFIWFRHDGKSYVSNDPTVLARFKTALEPVNKIGADMRELGNRMREHGKVMSELGRQMHGFQMDEKSRSAINNLGREMGTLGRQQAYVSLDIARLNLQRGDAKDPGQKAKIQREIDDARGKLDGLQQQMRKLEADMKQMTRAIEDAHKPMEAIEKKMEEASKPMEALGKQMEALGEQQDAAWHAAEPAFKALFADAVASGKATAQ